MNSNHISSTALAALAASALLLQAFPHGALAQDHTAIEQAGDLSISQAFSRATLPNAPVGGGYFIISNGGTQADRLVSATSPAAGDVQFHEMKMEGDVMKMRPVEGGIEIPAASSVTLAPGGLHLMFMDLNQPFVEGESVPVTLQFEKAGAVEIDLPVLGAAAKAAPMDHSSH